MGGAIADTIQDAPLGQFINWVSKGKYFAFPEHDPNFKIPWEQATVNEKEKEIEAGLNGASQTSSTTTPDALSREQSESYVKREDIEAPAHLSTIPTSHSSARGDFGVVTTRTRTREQTTQYSRERFEVEQEEAIERQQSSIIAPQRTADGILLVDWYTTDDPANPQNWNSWKKVWVSFIIFMYTFSVYSASAIYTSAQPQVMAKFGVGQAKGSLGLSMYVLGYGIGPM